MTDLHQVEAGTILITAVAVANVREQPEEDIPLVTQVLMGWPVQVMGIEGDWFHIQAHDGSPGWARVDHFCLPQWPNPGNYVQIIKATTYLTREPALEPFCTLFLGSRLPLLEEAKEWFRVALPNGASAYINKEAACKIPSQQPLDGGKVLSVAGLYAGSPYLWGGITSQGVDCSGLTYMAYFANGYQLPRDAQDQYNVGTYVEKSDLEPGDLVFFSTIDPGPSHVGIYQGDGLFINARTKEGVTVTSFGDLFFSTRYLGARRYL